MSKLTDLLEKTEEWDYYSESPQKKHIEFCHKKAQELLKKVEGLDVS